MEKISFEEGVALAFLHSTELEKRTAEERKVFWYQLINYYR